MTCSGSQASWMGEWVVICPRAVRLQSSQWSHFQDSIQTPSPKAQGSRLCVSGPGTKVCLKIIACLEGDTHGCVLFRLLVAFAGTGSHVNNLGKNVSRVSEEGGIPHVVSEVRHRQGL